MENDDTWWERNSDYVWETLAWIAALVIIFTFFACYAIAFGIFKSVGDGREGRTIRNLIDNSTSDYTLPEMTCTLEIEDSKYGVDVTVRLNCTTGLPPSIVVSTLFLNRTLNLLVNRVFFKYEPGDVPGIISETVGWTSGALQDYPFDEYTVDLDVWKGWQASEWCGLARSTRARVLLILAAPFLIPSVCVCVHRRILLWGVDFCISR
jgi:hypothetical protein